ncbi:amino acid ABC transporter permease [Proteiniclasticum sp. BAD-10]|uniref:Amino acid ABC transporter permease n=1 Tax=Proteiniclasticum sediminis TaxID=2804028 RepID=A0A941CS98_9CLOT|nr:amino acid ABC transporter permease [Proteiniclasticum sediminis]
MNIIEIFRSSLPVLLEGLRMTIIITISSLLLAMVVGLLVSLLRLSGKKALDFLAKGYIDIIRGTPLIIQAFFLYFGLPDLLNLRISNLTAGIIIMTLNSGAYMAEVFRGGILSVDKGQTEAARSLGLPTGKTMRKVILPQAVKNMVPAFINQMIISLKDTSLLSVIGLGELTQKGQIIVASTYDSFEIYFIVGVMYFLLIKLLSLLGEAVERRLRV